MRSDLASLEFASPAFSFATWSQQQGNEMALSSSTATWYLSRPFPAGILTNALPAGGVMASKPGQ